MSASRRATSASRSAAVPASERFPGNGTFWESFRMLLSARVTSKDSGAFQAS